MNAELDEALSAWIDGEVPPHDVLRDAIAQSDALATLRGLLDVRAAIATDAEPGAAAVAATRASMAATRPRRVRFAAPLQWATAAIVLLAIGTTIGLALAPGSVPVTTAAAPPTPDLVATFTFEAPGNLIERTP